MADQQPPGDRPPGDPPPHSFKQAVTRPTIPINESIDLKAGSFFRGEPALIYSKEEYTKLAEPFEKTLVGQFAAERPSMEFLRKGFQMIGFSGEVFIGLLDSRHVLLRFATHEDYYRCWVRGTWNFKTHIMKVFKWTPDFTVDHEPPISPVWVSFTHLPIHLFQKGPLLSIASLIGRPLRVDAATKKLTRPSVARVCIKVNLLRSLPKHIWIRSGDSGFWQPVIYEELPLYCSICSRFGHATGNCSSVGKDFPKPT